MAYEGSQRDHRVGQLLALLAVVCYSTVNALLRVVAGDIDPFVGSFVRQFPLLLIAGTALLFARPPAIRPRSGEFLGPRLIILLLVSGVVSFVIGNVVMFGALDVAGLAVAAAGSQAGMAVGGAILSAAVLREPPSRWQILGVFFVVVGLATMMLPSITGIDGNAVALGTLLSMVSGICYTTANTASRYVQRSRGRFLTALGFTNAGGILVLGVIVAVRSAEDLTGTWNSVLGPALPILLAAGFVNALALGSITLSVRYTSVTVVSMMQSLVLVLGVVVGWLVFDERLTALAMTGAAIILAGVLVGQIPSRRRPTPSAVSASEPSGAADGHKLLGHNREGMQ